MLRINKPVVENEYIVSDPIVSSSIDYYSNTIVKERAASSKRKFTEDQMTEVKKLLKEAKFTQKEIAYKVGIKTHTVSNIKNGKYNI
jgi:DNA-binding XRE family transcriptional regulator